jgi:hypothetical protein
METDEKNIFDIELMIDLLYLIADATNLCKVDADGGLESAAELRVILSQAQSVGTILLARASDIKYRAISNIANFIEHKENKFYLTHRFMK